MEKNQPPNNSPPDSQAAGRSLLQEVRRLLAYHLSLGIESYPAAGAAAFLLNRSTDNGRAARRDQAEPPAAARKPAPHAPAPQSAPRSAPAASLAEIRRDLGDCRRCPLCQSRRQLIFGMGPESASLFIIGQWPTALDDRQATPFSGEAGELLDRMLAAIKISRDQVFLTNIVKCRPADDRPPTREEISACLPFLSRQIAAVSPRVICTMGPVAVQALLATSQPLFRLRGRFHDFQGIPLMPTFHPDYLLSNPEMKKASWADLQMIQKRCENRR